MEYRLVEKDHSCNCCTTQFWKLRRFLAS